MSGIWGCDRCLIAVSTAIIFINCHNTQYAHDISSFHSTLSISLEYDRLIHNWEVFVILALCSNGNWLERLEELCNNNLFFFGR